MDTSASQAALSFQTITFDTFLREVRGAYRLQRALLGPLRPLTARLIATQSPYTGRRALARSESLVDDLVEVYGPEAFIGLSSIE